MGALQTETVTPDALARKLKAWSSGRHPLWALDFDGTLVALCDDPAGVVLSSEARELLGRLARQHECAILSGRAVADIQARVQLSQLHFVGNHGAEWVLRDGERWMWASEEWDRWRATRLADLASLCVEHGGWVEDKLFSLAVHFRGASDQAWWFDRGELELERLAGREARLMSGTLCWNLTPVGAPDKGLAALRLCAHTGHDSLIYFGDEQTDENVFRVSELPVLGVKVGPGASKAECRLQSPAEVIETLAAFLKQE